MGILALDKVLTKEASKSIKHRKLVDYSGKAVAIDTNISVHQFLSVNPSKNDQGHRTGHLLGLLQRTAGFLSAEIKPVFVFDGKPPQEKGREIARRYQKRIGEMLPGQSIACKKTRGVSTCAPVEHGSSAPPMSPETVRSAAKPDAAGAAKAKQQADSPPDPEMEACKELLRLLGVPVVEAPSEGEPQCVQLCHESKADAVASEDFDCLPLGAPLFLRGFNLDKKKPIIEYDTEAVLKELDLSRDQFIDFCIMCGCDYCDKIEGMDGNKALNLIREHHSIENILEAKSFTVPLHWPYKDARKMFKPPCVKKDVLVERKQIQEEAVTNFLGRHGFEKALVITSIEKIKQAEHTSKRRSTQTKIPFKKETKTQSIPKMDDEFNEGNSSAALK